MTDLTVNVGGEDVTVPDGEVRFLMREREQLVLSDAPDHDPERRLGVQVPMLDKWFFRSDSVPAARVLRIDGRPVANVRQELSSGRTVRFGLGSGISTGPRHPRTPEKPPPDRPPRRRGGGERPPRDSRRYVIGRTGTRADIEIDDPLVRREHATVRVDSQNRWWISGEIFVGGVRHMSATLSEGDVFVIGKTSVTVHPDLLPAGGRTTAPAGVREIRAGARRAPTDGTGLPVHLDHVTVYADPVKEPGKKRLDDVTLDIAPGEVVAVVGPSGAGKSSLINVLMGELAEDAGTVQVGPAGGGTDPEIRRRQVRYVPQGDEGLFGALKVDETLRYAARLRATRDSRDSEIDERVDDVLKRLGLAALGDKRVSKISGGQRRRVSIGTELVGKPQLLLLDEPTSGLDPGKDRAIMADLREFAVTQNCTVVIVTHATDHLGYVDKVVVMARGGRVHDAGPPDEVPGALGYETWADLMDELDADPAPAPGRPPQNRGRRSVLTAKATLTGLSTLLRREFVLALRRPLFSHALLLLIPLCCTLVAIGASPHGLRPGAEMGPALAILVTVAALAGTSLTYADLVNDSEKLRRDFRVGVETLPMVLAKAMIGGGTCAILAGLVTAVFALARELPPAAYGLAPVVAVYLALLLTMLASMTAGLLISAVSPTLERAVNYNTFLAVLQVALSGTLFHIGAGLSLITLGLPARLGLATVASYADLNEHRRPVGLYTDGLWNPGGLRLGLLLGGMLVLLAATAAGAVLVLHRRWTNGKG